MSTVAIFLDDDDRGKFLGTFSKLLVETDTEYLAWSLLTNHVHLLLGPRHTSLEIFMRRLLTGYALSLKSILAIAVHRFRKTVA